MEKPIYHCKDSCSWTLQSLNKFKESYGATFDCEIVLADCILPFPAQVIFLPSQASVLCLICLVCDRK